jgi:hypothetical protein
MPAIINVPRKDEQFLQERKNNSVTTNEEASIINRLIVTLSVPRKFIKFRWKFMRYANIYLLTNEINNCCYHQFSVNHADREALIMVSKMQFLTLTRKGAGTHMTTQDLQLQDSIFIFKVCKGSNKLISMQTRLGFNLMPVLSIMANNFNFLPLPGHFSIWLDHLKTAWTVVMLLSQFQIKRNS